MSEFRMKEVRALLNTTMESILRRAMFEIMRIVENSLHDHQLELSQKGEEIVQLKVKLQRVEMKLRDALYTSDPAAQIENPLADIQGEPEDVTNATTQPPVPETHFETVPEDWCAPVGYEVPTIPDEGSCPSVRLRRLSIPLYPIPIKKQEETDLSISPNQRAGGLRRSKRGTSSMQEGNQKLNKSLTATDQKARRKKVRNDMALLLRESVKVRVSAAIKSEPAEQQTVENDRGKTYHCRFCKAPFDSEFGRDVHERFHKWCRGCKTTFPSPDSLLSHKPHCKKLIGLVAKKGRSKTASGSLSNESTLRLKLRNNKQDRPTNRNESVLQSKIVRKKYSCMVCNKRFMSHTRQQEHMCVHTGEKPFICCFCPKQFRVKQSLKAHMLRVHKDGVNSGHTKGDIAWTEPLEMNEESASPGKAMSTSVNQKTRSIKKPFGFKGKRVGWKECGSKVPEGFSCNVCSKVVKTKGLLLEHHRVHTRERPYECPCCHKHYRYQGQFSSHYKKCIQRLRDKGMSNLPTDTSFSCKTEETVSSLQDASKTT